MNILQYDRKIPWYLALFTLAVFTLAMFADVIFFSDNLILSNNTSDIVEQFFYWRDFGFSQLKHGNLALWNPHIFSGAPFLGGFQSALLYPPNILYLMLPVSKAINMSIALHVLLIGFFMYLWTTYRNLHPLACLCSSVILMFSGAYFLHIYAGHLSNLCTMAWVPLLFLCIDRLFDQRSLKWSLMGMFTITMLILAGHPQYVYYTALAAGIYSALCLIKSNHRTGVIISLAIICIGSLLLSAVQILSGIDAARESMRSAVSYLYAASFSFPPENIMTLLVPNFFGDMMHIDYWGRYYLWEMSLFISITGLSLAIYGAFYGERQKKHFSLTMVIILLVLSLGIHTPFFNVLYHWLPGFNNFRGTSKFISLLTVFLVMLSGVGLDNLIRNQRQNIWASVVLLIVGIILFALLIWISAAIKDVNISSYWQQILNYIVNTKEAGTDPRLYSDPEFIKMSADFAMKDLLRSALICFLLAILFFAVKYHRLFAYAIAIIAIAEILIFANASKQSFDANTLQESDIETFLWEHPGDYRILNLTKPNSAMSIGARDIWGYDSTIPLRYAQFMNFIQPGLNPDNAGQHLNFKKPHKLLSMIRFRYLFNKRNGEKTVMELKDVMNHIHLISHWQVIDKHDDIFKEMESPSFDPRQTVILETSPDIESVQSGNIGECTIEDSSTDYLTIKGKLERPALLLITDSYSKGWQVKPLAGSSQKKYQVMPANYTLMAIPLYAGEHHLRLEYKPKAFVVGKWISLSALMVYLMLILFAVGKSMILKKILPNFLSKKISD
jgi:hypothetical protein